MPVLGVAICDWCGLRVEMNVLGLGNDDPVVPERWIRIWALGGDLLCPNCVAAIKAVVQERRQQYGGAG